MENHIDNCDRGLVMYDAFEKLMNIGTKKTFLPPFTTCNEKWSQDELRRTLAISKPYAIETFRYFDVEHPTWPSNVKGWIAYDTPVIIGMATTKSLGFTHQHQMLMVLIAQAYGHQLEMRKKKEGMLCVL